MFYFKDLEPIANILRLIQDTAKTGERQIRSPSLNDPAALQAKIGWARGTVKQIREMTDSIIGRLPRE